MVCAHGGRQPRVPHRVRRRTGVFATLQLLSLLDDLDPFVHSNFNGLLFKIVSTVTVSASSSLDYWMRSSRTVVLDFIQGTCACRMKIVTAGSETSNDVLGYSGAYQI